MGLTHLSQSKQDPHVQEQRNFIMNMEISSEKAICTDWNNLPISWHGSLSARTEQKRLVTALQVQSVANQSTKFLKLQGLLPEVFYQLERKRLYRTAVNENRLAVRIYVGRWCQSACIFESKAN